MQGYREYNSVAEMRASYAAIRKRHNNVAKPAPKLVERDWLDVATTVVEQPIKKQSIFPFVSAKLKAAVLEVLNVDEVDFMSTRRKKQFCFARQIFYFLARTHTSRSFPEIGRICGGRDHSTVIHGVDKIEGLLKSDCEVTIKTLRDVENRFRASIAPLIDVAA